MPESPNQIESYTAFRNQLQWEDGLFNQRVSWLLTFQAFLLFPYVSLHGTQFPGGAAQAIAQQNNLPHLISNDKFEAVVTSLQWEIPTAGVITSVLAFISCAAANIRINQLKQGNVEAGNEYIARMPTFDSPRILRFSGSVASHGIIFGTAALWAHQLSLQLSARGCGGSHLLLAGLAIVGIAGLILEAGWPRREASNRSPAGSPSLPGQKD